MKLAKKKIITSSLCSALLLASLGTGSAFAAENVDTPNLKIQQPSTNLSTNTPVSTETLNDATLNDLWSEKDFKTARIAVGHIKSFKDADGNLLLKVVNSERLEQRLNEMGSSMSVSELEDAVSNFNKVIVEEKGMGELTQFNNDVAAQYKKIASENQGKIRGITCSDALGAIGLIHAGSYTAAALLLGISGGLSAGIPFIISTAYYLGSLLC